MMEIEFTEQAIEDIKFHKKSGNKSAVRKIKELLEDIQQHPETGIGKPEALEHNLKGYWSRRIVGKHRLIYKIEYDRVVVCIVAARTHYQEK